MLNALRQFVEAETADESNYQKQQAVFGTFNIFATVASTIQPDREGQLWEELKQTIQVRVT